MNMELYIRSIVLNRNKIEDNEEYPFCLPVIRQLDKLELKSRVTFLVGENGTGKSTLLEAIAINYGFNPEGGSRNFHFSTCQSNSTLHEHITLVKGVKKPRDGYFLRAESFYNVATEIDRIGEGLQNSYGGTSLHGQSHGESFMSLALNRFYGNGIYILDEPEAALSPARQLALLLRLDELVKKDSQFLIATHSPILLAFPGADIYVLDNGSITSTPYMKTEHYILTKQFLNNPERMLKELLEG